MVWKCIVYASMRRIAWMLFKRFAYEKFWKSLIQWSPMLLIKLFCIVQAKSLWVRNCARSKLYYVAVLPHSHMRQWSARRFSKQNRSGLKFLKVTVAEGDLEWLGCILWLLWHYRLPEAAATIWITCWQTQTPWRNEKSLLIGIFHDMLYKF